VGLGHYCYAEDLTISGGFGLMVTNGDLFGISINTERYKTRTINNEKENKI
jgi:hypothetical protein